MLFVALLIDSFIIAATVGAAINGIIKNDILKRALYVLILPPIFLGYLMGGAMLFDDGVEASPKIIAIYVFGPIVSYAVLAIIAFIIKGVK